MRAGAIGRLLVVITLGGLAIGTEQAQSAAFIGRPAKLLDQQPRWTAAVQWIHVINNARVPRKAVRHVERALLIQLNRHVRPWWHTPRIRFGTHGWSVTIASQATINREAGESGGGGFHNLDAHDQPYALVSGAGGIDDISSAMSHELIEMLVNPRTDRFVNNYLAEICDPVDGATYPIWLASDSRAVEVQDFVTPRWFFKGSRPPYDQFRADMRPQDLTYGYSFRYDPKTGDYSVVAPPDSIFSS